MNEAINKYFRYILLLLLFLVTTSYATTDHFLKQIVSKRDLKLFPVTYDFRNYFIMQSIDNVTSIIIGDFVNPEKVIAVIRDQNHDNKVDMIWQYFPDHKRINYPTKPYSKLYDGFENMKKSIIDGSVFRNNYAYKMSSLALLKEKIKSGEDIYKVSGGYVVRVFDPDKPSSVMSEFYFARKDGRYDLQIKTLYYKIFNTRITPAISYSVYCRNSSDSFIKNVVDELIEMVKEN